MVVQIIEQKSQYCREPFPWNWGLWKFEKDGIKVGENTNKTTKEKDLKIWKYKIVLFMA